MLPPSQMALIKHKSVFIFDFPQQWEKSLACVSVPLMGEKLPNYCRVKEILAAVKNGPKLARPVVKWALEKLSLCLRTVF